MKGRETRLIQDYLGHRNITHTRCTRTAYRDGSKGFGGTERELNAACRPSGAGWMP